MKKVLLCLTLILAALLCVSAMAESDDPDLIILKTAPEYDVKTAREMLEMINALRAEKDIWYWNPDQRTKTVFNTAEKGEETLNSLVLDNGLERTAMARAAELAVTYYPAHSRPTGDSCFTAFPDELSTAANGENIAMGVNAFSTPESVFAAWREDDQDYAGQGHRRNMLNPAYTHVGIGYVRVGEANYWTQAFSSGSTEEAPFETAETTEVEASLTLLLSDLVWSPLSGVAPEKDSIVMTQGGHAALPRATVTTPEGTPAIVTNPAWQVADGQIAVIRNGRLKALSGGFTTLVWRGGTDQKKLATVSVRVLCKEHTPEETEAVLPKDGQPGITAGIWCAVCHKVIAGRKEIKDPVTDVQKVKLNASRKYLFLQSADEPTFQLSAQVTPKEATVGKVLWVSSRPEVASVNQKGLVTAHKKGDCVISAKAMDGSGKAASCTIKVRRKE